MSFRLSCTVRAGEGRQCPAMSPDGNYEDLRARAIKAGWRLWGDGEPTYAQGEAHCPEHVDVPGEAARPEAGR